MLIRAYHANVRVRARPALMERIEAKFETVVITKARSVGLLLLFPSAQVMTFVFRDQAPD